MIPSFKEILNATDLVVPGEMPLVWPGRRREHDLRRARVLGPTCCWPFVSKLGDKATRNFFYRREPGVAERLAEPLKRRLPAYRLLESLRHPFDL